MTGKAYRDRIAASKARLDAGLREFAAENAADCGSTEEFAAAVRERLNMPITDEYAETLMRDAATSSPRM